MMRRLAFLLRPGWIALALVVVTFTYLALTVLAPLAAGQEHPDLAGEPADRGVTVGRAGAGDDVSAPAGIPRHRRRSGAGSPPPAGICPTRRCWSGCG